MTKKRQLSILILVLLALSAWPIYKHNQSHNFHVIQKQTLANHAGFFRQVEFNDHSLQNRFSANVILLNPHHYQAQIIDHAPDDNNNKSYVNIYQATKKAGAFVGINGAFFGDDYEPVGLYIVNGKQLSRLSHSRLLSGLLLIDRNGQVDIQRRNVNYHHVSDAVQSGPFLINPRGSISSKSKNRFAPRTAIGLTNNNELLIISTTSTSLYDLAYALKHYPNAFGVKKISRVLNLDGGTSTALAILFKNNPIVVPPLRPLRSVIVFKLKK